jgi:hypothetical protein
MKLASALVALLVASSASAEPMLSDHGRLFIPAAINGVPTEALHHRGA